MSEEQKAATRKALDEHLTVAPPLGFPDPVLEFIESQAAQNGKAYRLGYKSFFMRVPTDIALFRLLTDNDREVLDRTQAMLNDIHPLISSVTLFGALQYMANTASGVCVVFRRPTDIKK